ncbi:MAG TPA: autoinducer binding domain-containing protein, partial [Phenylobacterium sp.]
MAPEYVKAWEFLAGAGKIASLAVLERSFLEVIEPFGFSQFNCVHVARPGKPLSPYVLFGRYSPEWDAYYMESGYLRRDPTIPILFGWGRPYSWNEVRRRGASKEGEAVFAEAEQAGLADGFVVPVH